MANENWFENAGRLFFSRERIKGLEKELGAAGVDMPPDSFAGYIGLNIIVVSIFLALALVLFQPINETITGIFKQFLDIPYPLILVIMLVFSIMVTYGATMAVVSSYLVMMADSRRNKLETMLPDFLSLVSSNIKAGMTLDQAMWYSAKPEFGLLSDEVKSRIKSSFSGQSMESTLDALAARFNSRIFTRTIMLLKQASATGGELTKVLESTADDVRNTLIMKKEIAASLVMYEIFVLFAAVIGTPFLFAVASKLIGVFEKIAPQLSGVSGAGGGGFSAFSTVKFAGPIISSNDFFWFSIPTIFITSLISSFIVSTIRTGSRSEGMKYFPFVLVLSYLVYWVVLTLVESIFATVA